MMIGGQNPSIRTGANKGILQFVEFGAVIEAILDHCVNRNLISRHHLSRSHVVQDEMAVALRFHNGLIVLRAMLPYYSTSRRFICSGSDSPGFNVFDIDVRRHWNRTLVPIDCRRAFRTKCASGRGSLSSVQREPHFAGHCDAVCTLLR